LSAVKSRALTLPLVALMTKKFKITVTRDTESYIAGCAEFPDIPARGSSVGDAIEKIRTIIAERLRPDDGSNDGTAPAPRPVSPRPGNLSSAKQPPQ
jgi:hypothetical protein